MNKLLLSLLLSISFISNSFCGGNDIIYHTGKTVLYSTLAFGTAALASVVIPSASPTLISMAHQATLALTSNEVKELANAILKK